MSARKEDQVIMFDQNKDKNDDGWTSNYKEHTKN